MNISDLPALNASLNALSTIFLVLGKKAQLQGQIKQHRNMMCIALATSTVFLTSYLIYHFQSQIVTKCQIEGVIRWLYYSMLFTHIVLATLIVPGIARGVWLIIQNKTAEHKQTMRWVWPAWLYVSITGVLVYLFLYHLQPHLLASANL